MTSGKHCVLDVTPSSVAKLQHAQYCPIVIYVSVETRNRLKELRSAKAVPKHLQGISTRKLTETSHKVAKQFPFLFTGESTFLRSFFLVKDFFFAEKRIYTAATLDATKQDHWFDALKDLIAHLQVLS